MELVMKIKTAARSKYFVGLLVVLSIRAYAGAESGGGGGIRTDESNPWFLGSAPIPYCVDVAPDFPVQASVVKELIQDAFAQWKTAYRKYQLYNKNLPGKFFDWQTRSLTVDAQEISECNQPEHQVRFKIGVGLQDPAVSEIFSIYSKYTVGEAFRKAYDHDTFRSGGVVWIAPKNWVGSSQFMPGAPKNFPTWNRLADIKSVLIHEIGHVLGFPHIMGTVMTPNLYSDLVEQERPNSNKTFPYLSGTVETTGTRLNLLLDSSPVVFTPGMEPDDGAGDDWLDILSGQTIYNYTKLWKKTEYFTRISSGCDGVALTVRVTATSEKNYVHEFCLSPVLTRHCLWQNELSFFSPHYLNSARPGDLGSHSVTLMDFTHVGNAFTTNSKIGSHLWHLQLRFEDETRLLVTKTAPGNLGTSDSGDWRVTSGTDFNLNY